MFHICVNKVLSLMLYLQANTNNRFLHFGKKKKSSFLSYSQGIRTNDSMKLMSKVLLRSRQFPLYTSKALNYEATPLGFHVLCKRFKLLQFLLPVHLFTSTLNCLDLERDVQVFCDLIVYFCAALLISTFDNKTVYSYKLLYNFTIVK